MWIFLFCKDWWDMLICRSCAVTLLKTMKIINSPICAEVLSTIISEFKLCVELHYDLLFYRPKTYQNLMFPRWEPFLWSWVRIPSRPQRVTSYPQSNLLVLSEKLTERQLRLTGAENSLWSHKNSNQGNSNKSTYWRFRKLLIGPRSVQRPFIDGFQTIRFLPFGWRCCCLFWWDRLLIVIRGTCANLFLSSDCIGMTTPALMWLQYLARLSCAGLWHHCYFRAR